MDEATRAAAEKHGRELARLQRWTAACLAAMLRASDTAIEAKGAIVAAFDAAEMAEREWKRRHP